MELNHSHPILKRNRSGCFIGSYYAGCIGYADDLLFLCPSRSGLQEMLDLAQRYVKDHQISFSTHPEPHRSKTKGMVFTRKNLGFLPAPLFLNGDKLPWVNYAKYLGNTVTWMASPGTASRRELCILRKIVNSTRSFPMLIQKLSARSIGSTTVPFLDLFCGTFLPETSVNL